MSLVESRALVEVRATSGVTLLPPGITAPPSLRSSKKRELNPDSHATESAIRCLPATSSVRPRWPLAGISLGGITVQTARYWNAVNKIVLSEQKVKIFKIIQNLVVVFNASQMESPAAKTSGGQFADPAFDAICELEVKEGKSRCEAW